jgi:diaminohydroxyphosphoribosylaminopyrimidine deaminase/5-amino-6-(5-phosphoribosylamino)uracil reductase
LIDSQLKTPLHAKALQFERAMHLYCALPLDEDATHVTAPATHEDLNLWHQKLKAFKDMGVQVKSMTKPCTHVSPNAPKAAPRVDLHAVMKDLAKLQMNELHIEAGATLHGSLLQAGLLDEHLLYFAPKWIGSGQNMSQMQALNRLEDAQALEFVSCTRVGPDLRILARQALAKQALL